MLNPPLPESDKDMPDIRAYSNEVILKVAKQMERLPFYQVVPIVRFTPATPFGQAAHLTSIHLN